MRVTNHTNNYTQASGMVWNRRKGRLKDHGKNAAISVRKFLHDAELRHLRQVERREKSGRQYKKKTAQGNNPTARVLKGKKNAHLWNEGGQIQKQKARREETKTGRALRN